jgi:hypothetical protein
MGWPDGEFAPPMFSERVRGRAATPDAVFAPPILCADRSDGEPVRQTSSRSARRRRPCPDGELAHLFASRRIFSRAGASFCELAHLFASWRIFSRGPQHARGAFAREGVLLPVPRAPERGRDDGRLPDRELRGQVAVNAAGAGDEPTRRVSRISATGHGNGHGHGHGHERRPVAVAVAVAVWPCPECRA